jgi:trigger factor
VTNRRYNPVWDFGAAGFVPGDTVTKSKSRESKSKGLPYLLKMGPMGDALAVTPVDLPKVRAPSTDDLEVTVPMPADLTQDDLVRRFHELKREHAKIRERATGEAVSLGDDVQLDTLGYCEGKLIAFSARFGLWLELSPQATLPGFAEAIAGEKVGDSLEIELTIPADYPVESLRGKPARFIVDLRAAKEVTEPDDEAPAFLKALKRGKTLDEVMDAIREELEDELADTLTLDGQDRVLDALIERANPQLPKSLIDEEVRRRWGQLEGKALVERGFDNAEQEEALQAWLTDPLTRADSERRLKIALVLKAITERDKLQLTPEKLEELATLSAEPFGLTAADVKKGLRESKELTAQMAQTAWHMLAVEHVMSQASITYEGA